MTLRHYDTKTLRHWTTKTLRNPKVFLVSLCISLLVSLTGCYKSPTPVTNVDEAQKKFRKICAEDLSINNVTLIPLPHTLYIYAPVRFDLLKTQASRPDPSASSEPSPKRQINFVDTKIVDNQIQIQYDITPLNAYPHDLGFQSKYTDKFSALHTNLLQALRRAYGDLEEKQKPLQFVVILIIDVRNGVAVKSLFHFKDLQMVMAQALPQDEYAKRAMSEMIGNEKFLNNPKAAGIDFKDITWDEFIAKQITYRIKFKYTRSSFPPKKSDEQEILTIVKNTMRAYNFELFETIQLENLATEKMKTITKEQLNSI